jgi:Domain of unknown function (DUF4150)
MDGMPASSIAGGECVANPDTCLTPEGPVDAPMVYPNTGLCETAVDTSTSVMLANMPAITQGTQIPMSQGDEPGVSGGVASGMIMGPVKFTMASSKVRFQGQGAVMVTATTMQNQTNATGAQVAPSQTVVMVAK